MICQEKNESHHLLIIFQILLSKMEGWGKSIPFLIEMGRASGTFYNTPKNMGRKYGT